MKKESNDDKVEILNDYLQGNKNAGIGWMVPRTSTKLHVDTYYKDLSVCENQSDSRFVFFEYSAFLLK